MAAKPRVHEVAANYGADSKVVLKTLKEMGVFVKGPSSSIEPPVARRLAEALVAKGYSPPAIVLPYDKSATAAVAFQLLPRELPTLIDALISRGEKARDSSERFIIRAATDRLFYFVPPASRLAIDTAARTVTGVHQFDLPSPTGIAILSSLSGPQLLLAWRIENGSLMLGQTEVSTYVSGRDRPITRLKLSPFDQQTSSPRDGWYSTDPVEARPLNSLAALSVSIPIRSSSASVAPVTGGQKVVGAAGADEGVHLVYITRSVGTAASPRSAEPTQRDSRWYVRGHLRQQWYPSTKEHKPVWIEEHAAGRGAEPAKPRQLVYVIRPALPKPGDRSATI